MSRKSLKIFLYSIKSESVLLSILFTLEQVIRITLNLYLWLWTYFFGMSIVIFKFQEISLTHKFCNFAYATNFKKEIRHCVKVCHIWSFSGPHVSIFGKSHDQLNDVSNCCFQSVWTTTKKIFLLVCFLGYFIFYWSVIWIICILV